MFEITVQANFAASHTIRLPDGSFEPIHTHDWRITATIASEQLDEIETVMDFHILEQYLKDVVSPLDGHHLNDLPPFQTTNPDTWNPSAERVIQYIALELIKKLPPHIKLVSATTTEAPNCTATYRPS
ncbi:6-carboxytetrahydropterin synthase [Planctomycetota bacterium]|nr:6-carboxytetrahydropterin synthase [Planctomycetota bacterium]